MSSFFLKLISRGSPRKPLCSNILTSGQSQVFRLNHVYLATDQCSCLGTLLEQLYNAV